MTNIDVTSTRWVGLNRIAMSCSMPNAVCQARSPTPPRANATMATSVAAYPTGTEASPVRRVDRLTHSTQPAVARNPE